jgi:hypothetical protein
MKADSTTFESAKLKLFRLSSISGEALARVEEAIDRELGVLHAASMGAPENCGMDDGELQEAAGRAGLTTVSLKDSIARRAAEEKADVILGKLDLSERTMLSILCGPDRVAQAERIVALRATNKGLR